MTLARLRLHSQLLGTNAAATPHATVTHFGAMQAQDYLGALWAVGVRTKNASEGDVEAAIARREIVRCWPMRGTLHFVATEDVRWMLDLLAPRVLQRHRPRLQREFDIDAPVITKSAKTLERALRGGGAMTRPEIYAALEQAKIATANSRGLHLLFALAHERLICFGARRGKQPTFVLLDEWVPPAKAKPREEALAELAMRYQRSHGPAADADFAWWSGLTLKEAREARALAGEVEHAAAAKWNARLLPPFDEYTVAYKNRDAVVDPAYAKKINAGGGMINAIAVVDGLVVGSWKRDLRSGEVTIAPFRELTAREMDALDKERARYARFSR